MSVLKKHMIADEWADATAGICADCDEPSQHLQQEHCDCCGLPIGLRCEDCYKGMIGSAPVLCGKCADEEERACEAQWDPSDHDRKYDSWKDGD